MCSVRCLLCVAFVGVVGCLLFVAICVYLRVLCSALCVVVSCLVCRLFALLFVVVLLVA